MCVVIVVVLCPVCSVCLPERNINMHLDKCLGKDSSQSLSSRLVIPLSCSLALHTVVWCTQLCALWLFEVVIIIASIHSSFIFVDMKTLPLYGFSANMWCESVQISLAKTCIHGYNTDHLHISSLALILPSKCHLCTFICHCHFICQPVLRTCLRASADKINNVS